MLGKKTKDEQETHRPVPSEPRNAAQSLISEGMRVVGHIETAGQIRIAGTVDGTVRAGSVEITETGCVTGDVKVLEAAKGSARFVVAGRAEASVEAEYVEVRATGTVQGGVVATEAVVHGNVEGGIVARERLALGASAVVAGDVRAQRLSLEEGGTVNGLIAMGARAVSVERNGASSPVQAVPADGESVGDEDAEPVRREVLAPAV